MNTVNVIEIPDTANMQISQLLAFPDDETGSIQAEVKFRNLIMENCSEDHGPDLEDAILEAIDNGYYCSFDGYYVCIVHSTNS